MRALIIEDEERLAHSIRRMLEEHTSFAVDIATDGDGGLHMALANPYDLILLDLMLPHLDGLALLEKLRAAGKRTPVLVLTARDTTQDIIRGLDLGCDDYLTKPFKMAELCARAKALVRRAYDRPDPVLKVGDVEINTATRTVTCRGKTERLPAMEYRLLEYLAMRAGEVVSKTDMIEHLYDFDSDRFSNVVEVYVSSLRRRFGAETIQTIRGQGYILTGAHT
ncbi:MAG TPA: response regulator transcription factor [Phycisphaerae bacterium]|nr:response regulator transcription factor [Phycisphaerae bacterium]